MDVCMWAESILKHIEILSQLIEKNLVLCRGEINENNRQEEFFTCVTVLFSPWRREYTNG